MQQGAPPLASVAPRVRVVRSGFLVRKDDVIIDASSSVTLVEAAGKKIIVDTGSPRDSEKLKADLSSLTVQPREIDIVVNTHLHIDHCGCNELFSNALSYAHKLEEPPIGSTRISGALTLLPGIELVPTPGHTEGSISVFVSAEKRYAICGDAIPTKANYDAHMPPFVAFDKNMATKSMEMILDWAQVVVPGHGEPFDVLRKR
jgi:N-acyl homoserine lactone hydrolase